MAGLVTLVGEDIQLIEPDINVIRSLERDGILKWKMRFEPERLSLPVSTGLMRCMFALLSP